MLYSPHYNPFEGIWKPLIAFSILALLIVAFGLSGCTLPKLQPVTLAPDTYEIPASPQKDTTTVAGKEDKDRLATITILTSDKPTTLRVYKKKVGIVSRMLSNEPEVAVVSNNPSVAVETPKSTLWWRWGLVLGVLAALLYWVGCKIYSAVPSWGSVGRLFARIFKE